MSAVRKPSTPASRLPPKSSRSATKATKVSLKENESVRCGLTTPKAKFKQGTGGCPGALPTPMSASAARRPGSGGTPGRRRTPVTFAPRAASAGTPVTFAPRVASAGTPVTFAPRAASAGTPVTPAPLSHSADTNTDKLEALFADQTVTVQVGVRVRPLSDRERADPDLTQVVSGDATCVLLDTELHRSQAFYYDHVFWSVDPTDPLYHSQAQVYDSVGAPLLKSAFEGYNVCLLAYGQTGSGKTYSMMGKLDAESDDFGELAGVIPRFCVQLFKQIAESTELRTVVQVSYYEIYQERIRDLLTDVDAKRSALRVREHPTLGPHVVGLTSLQVDEWPLMRTLVNQGNRLRATASTGINNKSSRSHSVLTLTVTRTQTETVDGEQLESEQTSRVNLVDLAGSERIAQTQCTGTRLKEGVLINKSLLTLGKVIMALVDAAKTHIPYRESTLTWLLKESLGGNSRTAMLATISPCSAHIEDTISTLRYACKANQIVNCVHVNEDPRARIIRELRAELDRLRQEQTPVATPGGGGENTECVDSPSATRLRLAITQLKRKLQQKDIRLRTQNGELEEAKRRLAEASPQRPVSSASCGVPFGGHVSQPSLVNLLPDPALTETVAFPLPDGTAALGSDAGCAVRLHGLLVDGHHCSVTRHGTHVTLQPASASSTTVNGTEVRESTPLQHGDRVVLAGEVFLRLHLPAHPLLGLKGFVDAKAELDRKNDKRIVQEQEQLRQRVKQELLKELEQERLDAELERSTQRIQLERQMEALRAQLETLRSQEQERSRAPVSVDDSQSSLDVSLFRSDLLEQIEGVFGGSAGPAGSEPHRQRPSQTASGAAPGSASAARLSQLVAEGSALFRRLGTQATMTSDLELVGDALCPVAVVTDQAHGVCTSWDVDTLASKVAQLKAIWEEDTSSSSGCDVSAVLDSRCGWQQQRGRRRSGRLRCGGVEESRRRSMGSAHQPDGNLTTTLATYCAQMVHECADWRAQSDGVRPVLLGAQALSHHLDRLGQASHAPSALACQDDLAQALVGLLCRWSRLSSAYAVWRRRRQLADEDDVTSVPQLDDVLERLQNAVGFVFQGIGERVTSLADDHLAACRQLIVRLCRTLGTAIEHASHADDFTDGLDCDTVRELCVGAVMALDHLMLETVRGCEDAEVVITGLVDDSVGAETADSAAMYSAAHELVACLRSWLQRARSLQSAPGAEDSDEASCRQPSELRVRLSDVQQQAGWVTALRSAVRLVLLSVHRHHRGCSLDRLTLCDAVRKLQHCSRRLAASLAAEPTLRQGRAELAAAAAALLRHVDAGDDSTASTVLSSSGSDASRQARTPDAAMFASLLECSAAGERLSPLPADQMAECLRHAVSQLEHSPTKSSLRSRDSPVKGRVQFVGGGGAAERN